MGASGDGPLARVEGEIVGEHVAELARVVALAWRRHARVSLDLVHVTFVDTAGAAALRTLRAEGVDLVGIPVFVSGLVDMRPDGNGAGGVR
jgi:anti-anti-sigma regulatory factor